MGGGALAEWRDGAGVLRILFGWLSCRLRIRMQQKMAPTMMSAAARSDPMTMPAMAPPERPDPELAPAPGVADSVPEGNRGGIDTVVGSSTPAQRDSTRELTQHELVELTRLSAQKEQRPCRLDSKPHSSGSFCTASMQLPLSELAGSEQRVKSARIWEFALLPGVPQSSGVDMTICSLVANSACTVLA